MDKDNEICSKIESVVNTVEHEDCDLHNESDENDAIYDIFSTSLNRWVDYVRLKYYYSTITSNWKYLEKNNN